jgi:formylglycine-generating enzyme required for sulfatase activity
MEDAMRPGKFILAALACVVPALWAQGSEPTKPQQRAAAAAGEGARSRIGKAGIEWVTIPGGTFAMGDGADAMWSWARPIHRVTIKTFQMAKTLVTNKQYKACVGAGACTPAHVSDGSCYAWNGERWAQGPPLGSFQGDDQPAVCVDWDQAQVFSRWAGGRLPTEAEWEYAARGAGKKWKYPWGDDEATCERAVIEDTSAGGVGCGRTATWPVCSKPKGNTPQGLCDMAGNVWEWMQDWYHNSYEGAPPDGSAWENPPGYRRVVRGGSWNFFAGLARSARRHSRVPGYYRGDILGFRPAR